MNSSCGSADAAQRVAADRDQPRAVRFVGGGGEGRRQQHVALDRAAHGGDAADLVDGRADDGEVEPVGAADIAVEHLADMQAEIGLGDRQAGGGAARVDVGDPRRASDVGASSAQRQAWPGRSASKIASVPSPISFSTSPPASWIAEITASA